MLQEAPRRHKPCAKSLNAIRVPATGKEKFAAMHQAACRAASALQEELHLDAGQFDDVVVVELDGPAASSVLPLTTGKFVALDMGDEVAVRPARDHRHLHAGLAQRGQGLGQFQLLAGIGAGRSGSASGSAAGCRMPRQVRLRRRRQCRMRAAASCRPECRPCLGRHARPPCASVGPQTMVFSKSAPSPARHLIDVLETVLAEFDDVAVLQEMLLDRLAVDDRCRWCCPDPRGRSR